ncbi:MAG: aldo/keto reductase [Candidatus Glassbacteria bacterium RIFCSPLOWO2_12_FULL_58_11]|uniref:Aldo/keto reductase n=1 Tax=Candidatus Glassbacteria bacterium RIFCSPLOWO2_12_FULL_58_11 TaxID=1817867 RepID=A0A1F5YU16_9BACT|nr:MAG: aldo/keto reductase [Candidatus Glassbacteria bacterium RIFCSPLOWO2_12_FULL_58_11]
MRYKLLGGSGLRVSEICLGAMTFGEEWGWGADKPECFKMMELFAKQGGNFIDTANKYTNGTSEKITGEFIASDREHFVLATKYSLSMRAEDPNFCGNHRKNLVQSLEASLKRLNTDFIDLYWLHAWDFMTPVEEVMRSLDDLVSAGKVLYLGISDTPAWIVSQANTLAEERGWSKFIALQIEYSLIQRTPERDLLPMARALDLAVTPWAVLGGGLLTGKYTGDPKKDAKIDSKRNKAMDKRLSKQNFKIAGTLNDIAGRIGRKPSQVAINWVRQQPGLIIPILGARTARQLKESLESLEFELDRKALDKLDWVSRVDMGFPHEFLSSEGIIKVRFGDTFEQIDNHRA